MSSSRLLTCSARGLHRSAVLAGRGPLTFDGWYPRDHMPNPYPENEEERRAAAMKYGMRPEDYIPMNKDKEVRRFAGDYPDLGCITYDHKDPYENWTDRHHRRNWGELVQMDMMRFRADRITYTGLDEDDFTFFRFWVLLLRVLVPMGICGYFITRSHPNKFRWVNPMMPKQYSFDYYRSYPWNDPRQYPIVNYTFEPADK